MTPQDARGAPDTGKGPSAASAAAHASAAAASEASVTTDAAVTAAVLWTLIGVSPWEQAQEHADETDNECHPAQHD